MNPRSTFQRLLLLGAVLFSGAYMMQRPVQAADYNCCGYGGTSNCRYRDSAKTCTPTGQECIADYPYQYCCQNKCAE